jgi:predicted ribosomally synthesized peptide with nif11-like leader
MTMRHVMARMEATMDLDKLKDPKLQERLRAAGSPDELLAIAKEQGYELSDKELEALSGSSAWYHCSTMEPCASPA